MRATAWRYALVALGGASGAVLRALMSHHLAFLWPWDVWVVNFGGTLLLAWAWTKRHAWHPHLWPLVAAGFCGGFTTVSTLAAQLHWLLLSGDWVTAGLYLVISLLSAIMGASVFFLLSPPKVPT